MKKIFVLFVTTALLISSCNLPSAYSPESAEAVQTSATLTVEAALKTPLASPTSASETNNNAQATSDTSSGQPFASFEDVTNCRTGPGVNYERITQITPQDAVEIIGFYPPNYWVVMSDAGPCWVAGEFVTPSGSIAAVPTLTAPPTPQTGAPDNVSLQQWTINCNYATNEAEVNIRWVDKDNESGYRVFRNNELATELPADSLVFTETITLLSGQSVGYYVMAFNAAGNTSSKTITLSC